MNGEGGQYFACFGEISRGCIAVLLRRMYVCSFVV
jgi:hypothetical protein